jgi:hypothetical protein
MHTIVPRYGDRRNGWCFKGVIGLGLVCVWVIAFSANDATAQSALAGQVENVVGTLVVVRPDGIEERVQGKSALQLFEWDMLRTEPSSQALLDVKDDIQVAVNENSVLRLLTRWEKAKGITRIVRLQEGEIVTVQGGSMLG